MLNTTFSSQDKRMLQYLLPRDSVAFSRYFFQATQQRKYIVNDHHHVIAAAKRKVFEGDITRLIVNMPPGYSKTEELVINFMAEGLAINPQALFMHLSYSNELALENSTKCRDLVMSPEYQELFPCKIRNDISSKKKWYTEQGGGVYATASGGQVTGFRAGRILNEGEKEDPVADLEALQTRLTELQNKTVSKRRAKTHARKLRVLTRKLERGITKVFNPKFNEYLDEAEAFAKELANRRRTDGLKKFWGALIIDDPIKPDDAYSEPLRLRINNRFMNTFKSRLAKESETPIILVMQRIHEEDPSGFLLKGGTGEIWDHLLLPVEIPEEPISEWYPTKYTHGRPFEYTLPAGPLWAFKHSQEEVDALRLADPYTAEAQYDQNPSSAKATIFKPHFWKYYDVLPSDIVLKRIYCDTAQKTGQHNDYTVFQCWGLVPNKGIYLIDQYRDKVEAPQLEQALRSFYTKHKHKKGVNPVGVNQVLIEDKSSGSSLIQSIRQTSTIPLVDIQRNRDKVMRSLDGVPYIASGRVHIPLNAEFTHDFVEEHRKFTPLMTHKHDDQIDPTLDAIDDLLAKQNDIYSQLFETQEAA